MQVPISKILFWSNIACDCCAYMAVAQQRAYAATQAGGMRCKFGIQHCLLVLAFSFDCPLATSGAATSSLSRRMLVSDNSLSLKMTYALNLSSSHAMPAHRRGINMIQLHILTLFMKVRYQLRLYRIYCIVKGIVSMHEAQSFCDVVHCHICHQSWQGVQQAARTLHLVLLLDSVMPTVLQHLRHLVCMPQQGRAGYEGV